MEVNFKIASWNLCLGLANKKDYVEKIMIENRIDVCYQQEIELKPDFNHLLLATRNYSLHVEKNEYKSRTGIYIKNGTNYTRRNDLEGTNSGVMIIDIMLKHKYRIINVYRSFNPPGGETQRQMFTRQLDLIQIAAVEDPEYKSIILGDFNLDDNKKYMNSYSHKLYFEELNEKIENKGFIQMVEFETWTRLVNGTWRSSILDHIYTQDATIVKDICPLEVITGDHKVIVFILEGIINKPTTTYRRDWRLYTKEGLLNELRKQNWDEEITTVQQMWNKFEDQLASVTEIVAPTVEFTNNTTIKSQITPTVVKRKMRLRKKLLNALKISPDDELKSRLKNLDIEIKPFHSTQLRKKIRKDIIPGNNRSLWRAVGIAKNLNQEELPETMYHNGNKINNDELAEKFSEFFERKIENLTSNAIINAQVYNGTNKINVNDLNFMSSDKVLEAMKDLKIKNSEGTDRIPQRILADGIELLHRPLSALFYLVYTQKQIPVQWKMSKITPIHKKGSKNKITNYRPIADLNAASKIFERLILNRIGTIEKEMKVDLTGDTQHGFKKGRSTSTASLSIQNALAKALEQGNFALMASLDLSSAFDVVNIGLLLKRMQIIGIPRDIIELVEIWLRDRTYYITCRGKNSCIKMSNVGTIQGSILGPFLYAVFVSPLFDLTPFHAFADDNQVIAIDKKIEGLKTKMQIQLEMMTRWLKHSGLIVNESKTELCLFHKANHNPIDITINNVNIRSKTTINVLGILFDSQMKWEPQVSQSINKARKALHGIKLIKKHFDKNELRQLLTSNYYSVLYYNSEVWHMPSLHTSLKRQLLSASAAALKIMGHRQDIQISHEQLHLMNARATPIKLMTYKLSLQLYKSYNDNQQNETWLRLNFQQMFNNRTDTILIADESKNRIGKNIIINRLTILNGKVKLDWMNLSYDAYKLKCKNLFLS